MTNEIAQINEFSEGVTGGVSEDVLADTETFTTYDMPELDAFTTESTEEVWQSIQIKTANFFGNATSYAAAFFKNNRQAIATLVWIFLAFLSAKLLFTALDTLDNIPLVTPLLKLVGLVSVTRFVWRYLIWKQNRQELAEMLNRAKAEVLGS
ncbi:MAG: CAAD domain-containing protein [Oscillatoriophycideae cyanobacterium NC_groundwater_1537_Pr4_S-0.65um_50_18]|nr:CAAD domain-containing protein [Oscillatoriophycideae cyanobacterium NC_groundwater_1537_Pr4_S-0.65um_50_18]